jgi:hypothetical protein
MMTVAIIMVVRRAGCSVTGRRIPAAGGKPG